ncbi:MAG: MFS transporter [Anaerolineaceae bacterium]|nr:MFS transporter [Anaerolineaceae bacterium]
MSITREEEKRIKNNPPFPTQKTILVSSAHAMHDTYSGFIAPLLPFLIERLSLLKAEAGLFILVYQGVSILQPIIGHLSDRTNLRKYALFAPAITAVFISLLGTAPSFQIALLYCFIAGISSATMHAILPAQVSGLSGDYVGKGMSIWMVGGEIGAMLGPLLVTAVIASFSIQATPWLMLGGIIVSFILSILLKDLPHYNSSPEQHAKIPVKDLIAILLPMAGIITMRSFLRTSSQLYLPIFLIENGASIWFAGISLSLLQGLGVIGTILGGFVSDRLGTRTTMILSLAVSALAMLAFSTSQKLAQIAFLSILSVSSLMVLPIAMAVVHQSFPENRSLANGLYLALVFGINALSGVVTGYMYDQIGGQQTFLWSGWIAFLGIPFIFLLPNEKKFRNNI